jgi:hypothetical protein
MLLSTSAFRQLQVSNTKAHPERKIDLCSWRSLVVRHFMSELLYRLLTCTELRNRIYEMILEQTSTHRTWLARRPAIAQCRVISPRLWNSKRPHMGLTQACQAIRNEFRPVYLNALRYSVAIEELVHFLDTFGPSDLQRNIKSTMMNLKQRPLPAQGVDILPMITILRSYQESIQVAYGWKRE